MGLLRAHWQMLVLAGIIFALWQTPVVLPLKLIVVFFHELSHGLAALATGGEIESLTVTADQGGLTVTRGGSVFAILSAGYLGSLLIGMGLFAAALRSAADRLVLALLGVGLVVVAALYVREGFALAFSLGAGGLMLAGARWLPGLGADLILRLIGLASMIYVPYAILSDTILRAHLHSDARMLAEEVGGATVLWGGLWLVVSLGAIGLALRYLAAQGSNPVPLPRAKAPH
ncbi:MAG TPA: M50 family peptidase [Rhodobacterales bacterium]|nr:M50 family peptidase [Rhodobacterales bacterium]